MKLSEHFTFDELTNTSFEYLLEANRKQAQGFVKQLTYVAHALEEIRAILGVPMTITSGYRSPALNKAVKGSPTSKHSMGLASDFVPVGMTVKEAFSKINDNKDKLHSVRKVIIEKGGDKTWIHIQAKVKESEPLTMLSSTDNGKTFQEVV